MSRTDAGDRRGPDDEEAQSGEPTTADHIREQVTTLVIAIAIALGIRAFVIEPFRIPSGSMLPTLLIGDHLFVNKFIYGPKVPFTDIRLPGLREPNRGDVVVFQVGRETGRHGEHRVVPADRRPELPREDFVKRIVGLPGDRIEVRNDEHRLGWLYVNDEPVAMTSLGQTFQDGERTTDLNVYDAQLGECAHAILDDPNRSGPVKLPAFTIEPDRYFFMGDNRDNSNDSRNWGTVHKDDLKGPAFILYWSWDNAGNFLHLLNPINWFTVEKRWDRVFKRVKCGPYGG
jgi:signal peptidase I